jgi:predicted phosphodiesterase
MRNAGSETMQLSYKEFVALLVPENADQDADVEESPAACQERADQDSLEPLPESRVAAKFEDELRLLLTDEVAEDRKIAEALQKIEDQQVCVSARTHARTHAKERKIVFVMLP